MDAQQYADLILTINNNGEAIVGVILALIVAITWKG